MPKQVTVQVADREYVIAEKFAAISEQWRKVLRESSIMQTLQSLDGIVEMVAKALEANKGSLDIAQVATIAHIVPTALMSLSLSMDDINTLIFDYVPEMAADREWVMNHAYDSDMVGIFLEVLKLNFPIMGAWEMVRGSKAPGTFTNLPTMNGAIGTKPRPAKSKAR